MPFDWKSGDLRLTPVYAMKRQIIQTIYSFEVYQFQLFTTSSNRKTGLIIGFPVIFFSKSSIFRLRDIEIMET